mgnify:CR=1 FL=1
MFVPKSECKSKAFIRNGQGKTGKNFRKMKNTQLLKTTNRRNILHTKKKEKYKVQRKKQRKERKIHFQMSQSTDTGRNTTTVRR